MAAFPIVPPLPKYKFTYSPAVQSEVHVIDWVPDHISLPFGAVNVTKPILAQATSELALIMANAEKKIIMIRNILFLPIGFCWALLRFWFDF